MGCGNNKQQAQEVEIPVGPTELFVKTETFDANAFFDDVIFLHPNSSLLNISAKEKVSQVNSNEFSIKPEDLEAEESLHAKNIRKTSEDEEAEVVKTAKKLDNSMDKKISKYPRKLTPIPNPPLPTTYTQFPLVNKPKPTSLFRERKIIFDAKPTDGFNFDFLDQIKQENIKTPKDDLDSLIKDLNSSSRVYVL
ncbi:unnamed protein product [Blepharisma stoltei]|uniref:Uncharacterized protein n=1 Tax=Blepharisma stoltei TaxID=1481888 RepID=A0AAU9K511_9CILI|nr:unnamed protein product [Blepharisma stoltei]